MFQKPVCVLWLKKSFNVDFKPQHVFAFFSLEADFAAMNFVFLVL